MLGDDVIVAVDTTEFGDSDDELADSNRSNCNKGEYLSRNRTKSINDPCDDISSADESDGETDLNQKFMLMNNTNRLNDTTSTAPKTEIFFNFKRNFIAVPEQDSGQTMEEMVEHMVSQKMESERAKLKEAFEMLESMRQEYRELLKERNVESGEQKDKDKTPVKAHVNKPTKSNECNVNKNVMVAKSPSDTTIYAPALARMPEKGNQVADNYIENITNFIEHMRH